LIRKLNRKHEAYVFDRVGSPMWAVQELMENDFEDFMLEENVQCKKLFDKSDKEFCVDTKYNVRFPGTISNIEKLDKVKVSLLKRKDRLINKLKSGESILFIRAEEPQKYPSLGNRLPLYEDKYEHGELYYLKLFSESLKTNYPNLKFKILFMNTTEGKKGFFVNKEACIVGIPAPTFDFTDVKIGTKMETFFKNKKIQSHITKHM
jgi:Putative papain-like cysteine peptidase (DUF1796)